VTRDAGGKKSQQAQQFFKPTSQPREWGKLRRTAAPERETCPTGLQKRRLQKNQTKEAMGLGF
jgi:hypothetical protein